MVDHFVKIGRKRIAVFYQIDAYGRNGWEGVRTALARHDIKMVAEATYRRGTQYGESMKQQVDILRTADGVPIVSATALRVLTANQATQFGLRYRINEQLIFRGSTDFTGDNRAVFEFETRF